MAKKSIPIKIMDVDCSHLKPQQRLFVERWALCRNYTQAAKEAGAKNPNVQGYRWSQVPGIRKVMDSIERKLGKQVALDLNLVREKLLSAVNRNYHDLVDILPVLAKIPPHCFPFIDGIKVEPVYFSVKTEDGYVPVKVDEKIEIKMMPNATAIDLAMKHLGGYAPEKTEQTISIAWDRFTEPPENATEVDEAIEAEYLLEGPEEVEEEP